MRPTLMVSMLLAMAGLATADKISLGTKPEAQTRFDGFTVTAAEIAQAVSE